MTSEPQRSGPPSGSYVPSFVVSVIAILLTIGILGSIVLDALIPEFDSKFPILLQSALVGASFGVDVRRGRRLTDPANKEEEKK